MVSWHLGNQTYPQCNKALRKSHETLQQQAETTSPQNQSHNRTDPSITGNHILKGTGRTEELKEIEVDVFEYFFHFKLFAFPFAKFF